jgi:hypothetical protein
MAFLNSLPARHLDGTETVSVLEQAFSDLDLQLPSMSAKSPDRRLQAFLRLALKVPGLRATSRRVFGQHIAATEKICTALVGMVVVGSLASVLSHG